MPSNRPNVTSFFDHETNTISHVVSDPATGACAVIDPVLGFDASACRTSTNAVSELIDFIHECALDCEWIIDTHVHADHLSAMDYVKTMVRGQTAIGNQIPVVQKQFAALFDEPESFRTNGSQFDHLFSDDERYSVGEIPALAISTPGHTPACMSHLIGDALFVGDTLFMPDYGSARCDFPGGSASQLFKSVQKLYELDDDTRMYLCHDYKGPIRDQFAWQTTVGAQKQTNVHINADTQLDDFVAMRTDRDRALPVPQLMLPALQVNIRAGRLPRPAKNGINYLKQPVNQL